MIFETKSYLSKLSLTLKILSIFLLAILLLAVGYPLLIKTVGAKLFLNNYVYGLGIKIVDEALLLSYFAIGAVIALLLVHRQIFRRQKGCAVLVVF
ncbi:MAG: hypothetical protein HQK53_16930 [Oligoflexia bacterium]|nr:hypothetical protein [Oligoflexia bacterium]